MIQIRLPILLLALAAISDSVPAQIPAGTIAVCKSSTTTFATISPLGVVTNHVVGPFSGTGQASSILHDPLAPSSFYIGGVGFIGRATFTTPTAATWSLLTTAVGDARLAGLDAAGRVVFADQTTDQIRLFDPGTGTVSNFTSGVQPWTTLLLSAVVDLDNELIYAGSTGGRFFRLSTAGGVAGPAAAFGPVLGSNRNINSLAIDPFDCGVIGVVTNITVGPSQVVRISPAGVLTDLVTPGSLLSPVAVAMDERGDFIVAKANISLNEISNSTGTVTALPFVNFTGNMRGVTVARPALASPRLDVYAPAPGAATLRVQGCDGDLWEILVSLIPANPTGSGFLFGINGDALGQIVNPIFFGVPSPCGAGRFDIPSGIPAGIVVDSVAVDILAQSALLGVSNVVQFTTF